MTSIVCAFAAGAIASAMTVAILTPSPAAVKYGARIAWSRVAPVYGFAAVLLVGAVLFR